FDGKRLGIRTPISLKDYLAYPHLLMSFAGDFEGVVDHALKRIKRSRRVVLSTTRFSTIPFILKEAGAIATLPTSMATRCAKAFSLTLSPAPLELDTFTISMLWHARSEQDVGHAWFRGLVRKIVQPERSPKVREGAMRATAPNPKRRGSARQTRSP
ncbi:MAG TPA: LysR substrate-binding domain-containing protein, partial [Burkholderiales bacterium]|nr:LysR substrate-binding domain-containing protein [Burkholderiales bacterium]